MVLTNGRHNQAYAREPEKHSSRTSYTNVQLNTHPGIPYDAETKTDIISRK